MVLKIVFMGTPEFAIPSFKSLLADPAIEILGVMTQPDRPSGRGQKLTPPPVKTLALTHGLVVQQPERLRKEPEMIAWLQNLQPDFLVTAAFGQILSQEVLDIPKYGTVNVHASLLPQYRGPNPVQWAILNGDEMVGITTMLTELGVDTGPILLKASAPMDPNEDTGDLTRRLAELGAQILPQSLHQLAAGILNATPQDEAAATHAPKLTKEQAWINWDQPVQRVHNAIRGQQPWPGAMTQWGDSTLKLGKTKVTGLWMQHLETNRQEQPGTILALLKEGLLVSTSTQPILVETLQPPGKAKMASRDWANGLPASIVGAVFTLPNITTL